MNKKEMLELLDKVDDDFEINFSFHRKLSTEELSEMMYYPYPYERIECIMDYDIGYSDKTIDINLVKSI